MELLKKLGGLSLQLAVMSAQRGQGSKWWGRREWGISFGPHSLLLRMCEDRHSPELRDKGLICSPFLLLLSTFFFPPRMVLFNSRCMLKSNCELF